MSKVEGFAAVPNWMVRDENVPGRDVLVYASLASRSGLGGIYPSQQTIAKETQLSERTVRTALRELEELGVIQRVTRRATKRGRSTGLTTMYTLTPNGNLADEEEPAIIAGRSEGPATEEEGTGKSEQVALLIEVEPVEVEARKRASRIPEPFMLTIEMKAWAAHETPGLDVEAHTREFVDHWRAASGQSAVKRDWVAAWRNWMRKAHRWQGPRETGGPTADDFAPGDEWMAFNR